MKNIIIFYVGTMILSITGGFIMAAGEDIGGLLFITSPLIMVLIVRFFLDDGWTNAGLKLNLSGNWSWYTFALLGYFAIFPLSILINIALGFTRLTMRFAEMIPILAAGFAIQFIPRMLYSISEEWAWRGYLEPKLQALGYTDLPRHFLVGILWAIWHFPLIMGSDYTTTPIGLFLLLFTLSIFPTAIVWGQMRAQTGSVWPAVLMHGIANTLGFAILEGNIIEFDYDVLGSIAAGNITLIIIWSALAYRVWHKRPIKNN